MNADYYHGISKIYFKRILSNIIKIANLNKSNKIILDFGCGSKVLSKILKNQKVLNYDINPNYTDHDDYKKLNFDIVILNHVLMYMEDEEILSMFRNIKKINAKCKFVIGIGKEGFVNKLAAILALNFKAHKGTRNNYKHQLSLIKSKMDIIDVKKNIFFMTDIFYTSFKD
jgi:hypothetical protein